MPKKKALEKIARVKLTLTSRYELTAFVSHMGPSNHSGHYVCHIRDKEDTSKWVIFNDNKVESSQLPMLHLVIPGGPEREPSQGAGLPLSLQADGSLNRLEGNRSLVKVWC